MKGFRQAGLKTCICDRMRSALQPSASRSAARPVPVLRRRPPAAVLPARGLQHKAAGRRGSWIAAASAEKQQVQEAGQRGRSGEAASRSDGSTADSSQGSGRRGLLGGSGRLALASVDEDASEGGLYNWVRAEAQGRDATSQV